MNVNGDLFQMDTTQAGITGVAANAHSRLPELDLELQGFTGDIASERTQPKGYTPSF